MKVAVECKSPLLQKSLELFLASHLSSIKQCDIVVRDFKVADDERSFYIGKEKDADLIKPFSKSALILALENRYESISPKQVQEQKFEPQGNANFHILEKRIDLLTKEYQQNIIKAVKAFYEK
ncbi:hypothetical protein [Sulfurimonas sp.]|uniref:hypothetical protein n=1 Tax=Sulfurimonas sp. TaxID=2022749 RepID=UPI002AAF3DE7|nr:hypothetical protein [Sulfurimonas sp.]